MATSTIWQSKLFRTLPESVTAADADKVSQKFRDAIQDAIEAGRWPIYMFGPQGRGKTCAAACVYARWVQRALWYDFGTAVGQVMTCRSGAGYVSLRANGREYDVTENQIFKRIADFPLVVFDDLGIRQPTDPQFVAFYTMVNSRVGKPTIYTSNIEPQAIEAIYDARIASRLLAGTVLNVTGADRRITNAVVVEV